MVERQARVVIDAPWPEPHEAGVGVFKDEAPRTRIEVLDPAWRLRAGNRRGGCCRRSSRAASFDKKGSTLLEAVMLGIGDALAADPRVFVYGEDVGGQYGNAFLLLRPLLEASSAIASSTHRSRRAPFSASASGAALAGQRPIGEMQFNDFVATGFNQLVNNAAKIRYRWGGDVPMVVRMPWGGLRHAGPYHSQNTEAVVLSHARLEDRRPVDAGTMRARSWRRPSPIPIRCSITSTSRSIAIRASSRCCRTRRRRRCPSARPRCGARAPTSR